MRILEKISSYAISKKDIFAVINNSDELKNLTYGELNDFSDRLAYYLQDLLKDDKTPIVVYGHKNPFMLVAFLACVKSGRAYCPIDVSVPLERVKDIIKQIKSPLILTTENLEIELKNEIPLQKIKLIINETDKKIDPSFYVKAEDVFYIIFTSGSTGNPKGVQITEQCLFSFLNWAISLGGENLSSQQLIFINQAPFSFDLSVMDLYMSLYLGGSLWCLTKEIQSNAKKLLDSLEKSNANVWVSTPSFVNLCLASDCFSQNMMKNVKLFLFCGETLTNNTASKLIDRFEKAKIVNTYGPTESTVAITEIVITDKINKKYSPLPVGNPKPGTFVFIIDKYGNKLADGEKGELVIVGDSVSVGYFNNKEMTDKVFSSCEIDNVQYRSYKTGDEAYIKDGLVFYSGRIDLQVKLHGYRIEIEDIENNLLKLESIKNATVIPNIKNGNVDSLVAFVSTGIICESNLKASRKIKKELSAFLPSYMIPKKFIFIDSFPMTNNGKVDRKKLKSLLNNGGII